MSRIYPSVVKRAIDLSGAFILLSASGIVFVFVTAVFFLKRDFPVFYRQKRIGKNGVPFELVKFRTLKVSEELSLQERRFTWGDFLRRYSLDELPQLWNVIRGEMSLVGPRPLPVEYARLFSEEQKKRHNLLPGITGLAQVNGRNSISWKKKLEFDNYYVRHVSMWLDFRIMVATAVLIFSFHKDVSLHEQKFTGEE